MDDTVYQTKIPDPIDDTFTDTTFDETNPITNYPYKMPATVRWGADLSFGAFVRESK